MYVKNTCIIVYTHTHTRVRWNFCITVFTNIIILNRNIQTRNAKYREKHVNNNRLRYLEINSKNEKSKCLMKIIKIRGEINREYIVSQNKIM